MAWLSPAALWRMGVMWSFVLLISYIKLFFRLIFRRTEIHARCSPNSHSARACIVTGASSGIGRATAETLALEGYRVILAGRSLPNLMQTMNELKRKYDEQIFLYPMELDLSSVPSIVAFVDSLNTWLESQTTPLSLQLLVNNAGIMAASERCNADGYDSMIMTNYLGPCILTRLLLPVLQKCPQSARIVNVVSFTHRSAEDLDITKLLMRKKPSHSGKSYEMAKTYESSKLALLLFTYELHRRNSRFSRVSVNAADPGLVETQILRELPWWLVQFTFMMFRGVFMLQTSDCGARAVVDASLAPMEVSGKYFFGGNGFTLASSKLSYNTKLAKELWDSTNRVYNQAVANSECFSLNRHEFG